MYKFTAEHEADEEYNLLKEQDSEESKFIWYLPKEPE